MTSSAMHLLNAFINDLIQITRINAAKDIVENRLRPVFLTDNDMYKNRAKINSAVNTIIVQTHHLQSNRLDQLQYAKEVDIRLYSYYHISHFGDVSA